MLNILGISGSLRWQSTNSVILDTLAENLGQRVRLTAHLLDAVPLYDQDLDTDTPPAGVAALRAAIHSADALIVASPEYNHGMPGVLKNAIDWASRPYGRSSLIGKPVLSITSSPGALGGVRAQAQLNDTFLSTQSRVLARPQAVIPFVMDKIRDGRLVDASTLEFLLAAVDDLIAAVPASSALSRAA